MTQHEEQVAHLDPSLGLGDVWKYSQYITQLIATAAQFHSLAVGQAADFGPLTTWLPDSHEYEVTLHVKKKK